ncbi:hypothetical protein [Duganella sp. Root1480D1]|uniref:hypothetical protein n=1 Tax=Duganella sp. Root1480D1 TaxID=1736471 RepID=UPI00070915F6|nr:hypothetical protein [Duganella sp. Root1480D1]KQZ30736.1 hypothetical protein ASD58_30135 [Duganella sp. Root1480D1]
MTEIETIEWLAKLKTSFEAKGLAGEDFFYIIRTMLRERRISFPEMMSSAVQGHGTRVHEGLEFILDADLDDPADFDGVIFVIGEHESSILSVVDYVHLVDLLCHAYITQFPDDKSRVMANLDQIKSKYATDRQA